MEHTAHGPPIRPSDKTNESDGRVMQCKSMMERKNKAKIGVGNMRRDFQRAEDVEIYAKEGEERDETTQDHDEALNAEDIETKKILPTPVLPSQADIDEHNIDHLPFRRMVRGMCERPWSRKATYSSAWAPEDSDPGIRLLLHQ